MQGEKIKLRTENGQLIEAAVFSKRADAIEVVIGEGIHNMKCTLTPTRNGLAYAGSIRGRELVYEKSRQQVEAELGVLNQAYNKSRPR
ncbi:MAG: hypothetical protein ACT4P4_14680 [Betaproteobacteria bacterium]